MVLPFLMAAFFLFLGMPNARAGQFTFLKGEHTWTKAQLDLETMQGPTNWVSPVNYVDGKVYARFEAVQKPSNKKLAAQLCIWQREGTENFGNESCAKAYPYTKEGVYYINWGTPSTTAWWKKKDAHIDYTRDFFRARIMQKDGNKVSILMMTSRCGKYCYPGGDIDSHVPIKYKIHVVVVSKGAKLVPPADWTGNPWGQPVDTEKPTIKSIISNSQNEITVVFSEPLAEAAARNASNYGVTPQVSITSARVSGDTVTLTTGVLDRGTAYTLAVRNVKDLANNAIAANASKVFNYTGPVGIVMDRNASLPPMVNGLVQVELNPNPVRTRATIGIKGLAASTSSKLHLAVYDVRGRMVENLTGRVGNEITWNPGSNRAGIYWLVFRQGAKQVTTRIVLID